MTYDELRQQYRPQTVVWLLVAESPPPIAEAAGSRHFYRSDQARPDDRLFTNTIKAFYAEAADQPEAQLQTAKEQWLRRFQADGCYMVEALEKSLIHTVTKPERVLEIQRNLPRLIERISALAGSNTKVILIKSNVYEAASEALKRASFKVLNHELVDYPGRFNQRRYRQKLRGLLLDNGWRG